MLGGGGIWNDGALTRSEKETELGEQCYFASPYDLPAYVRFFRRITEEKFGRKALSVTDHGVTMEVSFFTFGVTLYVRYDRANLEHGAKLKIIVEDDEGREVLASYETEKG